MIIDIHTHVGEYPAHIGEAFAAQAREAWAEVTLGGTLEEHRENALQLPMLIHQGTTFARAGSLLQARPILLDEIALRSVAGEAFGSGMPTIDPEVIEGIIHRPSLELLGID